MQGKYFLALENAVSSSSGPITATTEIGGLWITYDVELFMAALDSTGGFTGNGTIIDQHSGLQTWCWHKYQSLSSISTADLVNMLDPFTYYESIDGTPFTESFSPDIGTVGDNDISLEQTWDGVHQTALLKGHGVGIKFMLSFNMRAASLSGSFSTAGGGSVLTPDNSRAINCVVSSVNEFAVVTTASVVISTVLILDVVDASQPWSWGWPVASTGYVSEGTSTGVQSSFVIQLMQHAIQLPGTLGGCVWRYKHEKKKRDFIDLMGKWSEEKSCQAKDCTICPLARLARAGAFSYAKQLEAMKNNKKKTSHPREREKECSDSDSSSEEEEEMTLLDRRVRASGDKPKFVRVIDSDERDDKKTKHKSLG
jgi:hypothetical protein